MHRVVEKPAAKPARRKGLGRVRFCGLASSLSGGHYDQGKERSARQKHPHAKWPNCKRLFNRVDVHVLPPLALYTTRLVLCLSCTRPPARRLVNIPSLKRLLCLPSFCKPGAVGNASKLTCTAKQPGTGVCRPIEPHALTTRTFP